MDEKYVARFWSKVDKRGADECWPWLAGVTRRRMEGSGGYGRMFFGTRKQLAHRIAWQLTHGPVPDDLVVMHSCDHPWCCNPAHLSTGTVAANNRDCNTKGRRVRLPRGSGHYRSKIDEATAVQVVARIAAGESITVIAKDCGLTAGAVWRIKAGKNWKHLSGAPVSRSSQQTS